MEGQTVVSRWSLFERNLASVWVTFSGRICEEYLGHVDFFGRNIFCCFLHVFHIFAVETSCFPEMASNTLINDPMAGEDGRPSGRRKLWSQRVASQVPALENCQGPCMENMEHVSTCGISFKLTKRHDLERTSDDGFGTNISCQPEVYDWRFWKSGVLGPLEKTSEIPSIFQRSSLFEALLSSTWVYLIFHAQNAQIACFRTTLWMVWLAWCNPVAWVLSNPTAYWHSGPKMCWPWVEKVLRGDPTWWPGKKRKDWKTQRSQKFHTFSQFFTYFHCDGQDWSSIFIQFHCISWILLDGEECPQLSGVKLIFHDFWI